MYSALRCWQNTAAMEGPLKQYGWLPLCSKAPYSLGGGPLGRDTGQHVQEL